MSSQKKTKAKKKTKRGKGPPSTAKAQRRQQRGHRVAPDVKSDDPPQPLSAEQHKELQQRQAMQAAALFQALSRRWKDTVHAIAAATQGGREPIPPEAGVREIVALTCQYYPLMHASFGGGQQTTTDSPAAGLERFVYEMCRVGLMLAGAVPGNVTGQLVLPISFHLSVY